MSDTHSRLLLIGESNNFFSFFEPLIGQPDCRLVANGVAALHFIKNFQPDIVVVDSMIVSPDPWQLSFMLEEEQISFAQKLLFVDKMTTQLKAKAHWMHFDSCIDSAMGLKQFKSVIKTTI